MLIGVAPPGVRAATSRSSRMGDDGAVALTRLTSSPQKASKSGDRPADLQAVDKAAISPRSKTNRVLIVLRT